MSVIYDYRSPKTPPAIGVGTPIESFPTRPDLQPDPNFYDPLAKVVLPHLVSIRPVPVGDNFDPDKGGIKLDAGKPRLDLLPTDALEAVAEVFGYGANKYGSHNWAKGGRWGRWSAAALRHVFAWMRGEEKDKESGLPHLSHAICSLLMLLAMTLRAKGEDDRSV